MFLCVMDDDTKEMVTTLIPALTRCPQNAAEYLRQLLQILLVMIRPHPYPLLNIRHIISNGQIEMDAMHFPISYHTDTRFI
jgi:hypothetical protein